MARKAEENEMKIKSELLQRHGILAITTPWWFAAMDSGRRDVVSIARNRPEDEMIVTTTRQEIAEWAADDEPETAAVYGEILAMLDSEAREKANRRVLAVRVAERAGAGWELQACTATGHPANTPGMTAWQHCHTEADALQLMRECIAKGLAAEYPE